MNTHPDICILGAGIMGSCLGLELAERGYSVTLIDMAPHPMTGASLHNEGKLHLGFVYANDPHKITHRMMIRGSLSFSKIIERLTGCDNRIFVPSKPFHYFIPNDSQLSICSIEKHFYEVEKEIRAIVQETGFQYLNKSYKKYYYVNQQKEHNRLFCSNKAVASFRTEERAVSTAVVAGIISEAVRKHPKIQFVGNTEVLAVTRLPNDSMKVHLTSQGIPSSATFACVANCLWEGKYAIDRSIGIVEKSPLISRFKVTITVEPSVRASHIPSATGILGSYGDIVNHNDTYFYISWYPRCKVAQSVNEDGRLLHDKIHPLAALRFIRNIILKYPKLSKKVAFIVHRRYLNMNIREMAEYVPPLQSLLHNLKSYKLGGGVIIAKGSTDIDDPNSHLHQRSTIGPVAYGSYVTIDTGKYCTAPLFAVEAADMITEILH